jgi:hypothetical protein
LRDGLTASRSASGTYWTLTVGLPSYTIRGARGRRLLWLSFRRIWREFHFAEVSESGALSRGEVLPGFELRLKELFDKAGL